jgi:hypothetical protein
VIHHRSNPFRGSPGNFAINSLWTSSAASAGSQLTPAESGGRIPAKDGLSPLKCRSPTPHWVIGGMWDGATFSANKHTIYLRTQAACRPFNETTDHAQAELNRDGHAE